MPSYYVVIHNPQLSVWVTENKIRTSIDNVHSFDYMHGTLVEPCT